MVQTKPALLSNGDRLESKSSDFIQTFADIRNKYTNKLEQVWMTKLSQVLPMMHRYFKWASCVVSYLALRILCKIHVLAMSMACPSVSIHSLGIIVFWGLMGSRSYLLCYPFYLGYLLIALLMLSVNFHKYISQRSVHKIY